MEKIDYMTSPGWIDGPNGRKEKGLSPNKGPQAVVTDLGIMKFDSETKKMYVAEYYPGVTLDQIIENPGFEIDVSRAVESIAPESEIIKMLREEIDPSGIFI